MTVKKPDRKAGRSDIEKLAEKLTPNQQAAVLQTVDTLLYLQHTEGEDKPDSTPEEPEIHT